MGKNYDYLPMTLDSNKLIKKNYIESEGWNKETRGCRSYADLPEKTKDYISSIEKMIRVPITLL